LLSAIHQRLQSGEYETITTAELLAHQLTNHLQEISKDTHLHLFHTSEELPERPDPEEPAPKWWEECWPFQNFGFEKVERLPGNIGYLDVHAFYPPGFAGDVTIAAMNFLANTSVLIIDLRNNDGGEPAMVALICNYFFDAELVHLNSFYWRTSDSTQQVWTLPYVPGKRYLGKPVYLLTSRDTVSGAEEFAYTLKNMKRATAIGEVTGGAAHPGQVYKIHPHFGAFIPTGRHISPITGTDWERTGVIPDIEIPQDQALKAAQVLALKQLLETSGANEARDQRWFVKEATDALAELEQK
jgi:C-terminal processing protease CtpA/Prc